MNSMEYKREMARKRARRNEAAAALGMIGIVILFIAMLSMIRVGIVVGNVILFALAALIIEAAVFVGTSKRRLE